PAVGDAVALPWPNLERGEDVAAFVVAREPVEEAVLLDHCRAALASYKVPRGIFFIDEMPKSALGKIIKADLAARLTSAG
ncbi:MAG: long-chain fatty acid--CoA ligase, partial [Rhodospirillaceae bacterium]|nr:long-chain fatty acid--CoA ligase [Rhodospirillaceae bacterium]